MKINSPRASSIAFALVTAIFTIFAVPLKGFAEEEALDFVDLGGGSNYHQGSYSLGWSFSTNQDVKVSALGFYDDTQNGLKESHEVGIFDADNCNLLVKTTVSPSDTLTGFFRYHDVVPVVLPGGHKYLIAAVTGAESYAIYVGPLTVSSSITFGGYAIFGNTQSTNSLNCPTGPANQPGFHGDFGPSFKIGGVGATAVPTETPAKTDANKRPTGISLFCNRTGVNLETAKCSASIADAGPPPRSLPTGGIDFVTTGGFFPANGSCLIQQTPFSPGIGSCDAEFAIPFGFPIGVKFPIDVLYKGDATFAASSTSHALIQAGCIGDQSNPCSGAVALSFANLPQIVKNALTTIFECGAVNTTKAFKVGRSIFGEISKCVGKVVVDAKIGKVLSGLELEQIKLLTSSLSNSDVHNDPLLKALKTLGESSELPNAINNEAQINILLQNILKDQNKNKSPATIEARSKKISTTVQFGSADVSTKTNSLKNVKVKLTKTASKLVKAMKAAGIGDLNLDVSVKGKHTGKKKLPFAATQNIDVGIN